MDHLSSGARAGGLRPGDEERDCGPADCGASVDDPAGDCAPSGCPSAGGVLAWWNRSSLPSALQGLLRNRTPDLPLKE